MRAPVAADDDEWREAFELFQCKRAVVARVRAAHMECVHAGMARCTVRDGAGALHEVSLPWERRQPHVCDVVRECSAFRVAVEHADGVVVRATLEVCDARLAAELDNGAVRGEVYLVHMMVSVWKDVVALDVPPVAAARDDDGEEDASPASTDDDGREPLAVGGTSPSGAPRLHAHQRASMAWMARVERRAASEPLRYEGNLRLSPTWFLDTEQERLTTHPSWREADVRGGILGDWPGAGKTATALRHAVAHARAEGAHAPTLRARGTLVVLPLNLCGHWLSEAERFCPGAAVVCMLNTRDVRRTTMRELLHADVTLTTFQFLLNSRAYHDAVEEAIERRCGFDRRLCRTRAAIAAWARRATADDEPVVEAVHWHRLVVDEAHEAFGAPRRVKALRSLCATYCWGISATPHLDPDAVHNMHYWLLEREKAHHPNLLARLGARCVRTTTCPWPRTFERRLRLVDATEVEHARIREAHDDVERVVQLCTRVLTTDDVEACDAERMYDTHALAARSRCERLRDELRAEEARVEADDVTERMTRLRVALRDEEARLRFVREGIDELVRQERTCPICDDDVCGVILPCGHIFCRRCVAQHVHRQTTAADECGGTCPMCRTPLRLDDARGVVLVGTKMATIADVVCRIDEPVIVFVQWKAMLRSIRAVLRGRGVRTFTLDGNAAQRTRSLSGFAESGVLLLDLNESFAGLHLPHARHVVFSHAIVGSARAVEDVEAQAIARCLRHGQTRRVHVHSFVVADTAEEDLWRRDHCVASAPDAAE